MALRLYGFMAQKAKIIHGQALSEEIKLETASQIAALTLRPGLAVILVGNDPASALYVALKAKAAKEVGIMFSLYKFEENATEQEILETINWLNQDQEIHAILVQLPLPEHLDASKIISAIQPVKDVDGFHPENIKNLVTGKSYIIPGLVIGIMQLLSSTGENLENKKALILARSPEFTTSLSYTLGEFGIESKTINPDESNAKTGLRQADIVIVAAGKGQWIKGDDIKEGAMVIDVGTNRLSDKTVVGDVDFETCSQVASWITPVPGGVGPMTVAMLLKNTVALAITQQKY